MGRASKRHNERSNHIARGLVWCCFASAGRHGLPVERPPLWNTRPRNVDARAARRTRSNTTVTILLCSGVQDGSGIAALLHDVSTDSWVWQRSHKGHANVRSFICVGHPHLWWPPTSCSWSTRACPTTEVATFSGCGVAPNRSPLAFSVQVRLKTVWQHINMQRSRRSTRTQLTKLTLSMFTAFKKLRKAIACLGSRFMAVEMRHLVPVITDLWMDRMTSATPMHVNMRITLEALADM